MPLKIAENFIETLYRWCERSVKIVLYRKKRIFHVALKMGGKSFLTTNASVIRVCKYYYYYESRTFQMENRFGPVPST